MRKFVFALLFIASTLMATAGGFQVNLQGQKQTGMGHTGTGLALGPSSLFFNPGAFSLVDSNAVYLGASFIMANTLYLEPSPGIYTTETKKGLGTPFTFYSAFRLKPENKWNIGIGVYTPFGSGIAYEDNWLGQAVLREMSLKTIFIQPTFSYRVNDKLGVGIGYVFGTGSFLLRKAVPAQDANGNFGEGELSGNATGHGFNIGVHYQATEALSVGVSYRSGVKVSTDDGEANFTVASSLTEFFPSTSFSTEIALPKVVNFGLGYQLNEKTLLAFDLNYIGWSSYDTLSFDFAQNTDKLDDINSPREYNNVFIFRLGGQYQLNEKATVRLGAYYDLTPVDDPYITPETPDANKLGITAGASYRFSNSLNVDLSFLYLEGEERTAINSETEFGGTWKANAIIPGIGVQYSF